MNANSNMVAMLTKKCKTCGKLFEVISSSGNKGDYCSKECHYNNTGGRVIILCKTCGEPFEVTQSNKNTSKYCSKECYTNKNGGKVVKICPICGKVFTVKRSRENSAKYCSKECYYNRNGEKKIKICEMCGKTFTVHPCHKDKIYCSEECFFNISPRIIKICEICGNEFEVNNSYNHARFCSMKCQGIWQTKTRIGENSANWQGGISFDPYCEKFNPTKRKEVRDKYNNCDYLTGIHRDICNKTKSGKVRELSVHHIDYDKMQGCDDIKWKLIPVSARHNTMFNSNKPFWKRLIEYSLEYDKEYYLVEVDPQSLYTMTHNIVL